MVITVYKTPGLDFTVSVIPNNC